MKIQVKRSVRFLVIGLLILISFPLSVCAEAMDAAVEEAVELLKERGLGEIKRLELIIEVINKDSQDFDREARLIQSSLYSSLQSKFPQAKLMLKEEAIAGVSGRAIKIKGAYQQRKGKVIINFQAIKQMAGEMIAKADVEYASAQKSYKNLVVVMPLEALSLDKNALSAFSTIFRSALINTRRFDLVSSDAIDNADPEKIQNTYKCSREECSTIVAQQLNASRVITTSYRKISSKLYFLSGSLKDISTGRTVSEESIKHDGNLETLEGALEELACQLAKTCGQSPEVKKKIGDLQRTQIVTVKIGKETAEFILDEKTGLMWQKGEPRKKNWEAALNYCRSLTLAGYFDWRLPARDELKTAYQIKSRFPRVRSANYWSSTTYTGSTGYAWSVYFRHGGVYGYNKGDRYYVRCVRG